MANDTHVNSVYNVNMQKHDHNKLGNESLLTLDPCNKA